MKACTLNAILGPSQDYTHCTHWYHNGRKRNINQISSLQAAGSSFKLCIKRPYLVQESTLGSRGSRTHIGDGAEHEFEICRGGFNSYGAVLIALEGEFEAVKGVVDGGS